jgi:hypothetical protein
MVIKKLMTMGPNVDITVSNPSSRAVGRVLVSRWACIAIVRAQIIGTVLPSINTLR